MDIFFQLLLRIQLLKRFNHVFLENHPKSPPFGELGPSEFFLATSAKFSGVRVFKSSSAFAFAAALSSAEASTFKIAIYESELEKVS